MLSKVSTSQRVRARALRTSAITLAMIAGSPAFADCAPKPTEANATTTCSGTDSTGVRVTTTGSTVQVDRGATVRGSGAPAITVDIAPQPDTFATRTSTITVAGTVDGGAQSGIAAFSGDVATGSYDFYGTQVTVSVAAGATVTGTSGITAGTSPSNAYGSTVISLDNAGTITGTTGAALLSTDRGRAGFGVVNNAASGSIAGIVGTVGELTNAGLITGGASSAIDQTTTYNAPVFGSDWTNSGTITSQSAAATIANLHQFQPLTNSGTISNAGAGAAVQGDRLVITNLTGGQISSAGSTAIASGSSITLTNAGTITGGVVARPAQGTGFSSTIDSTAGRITGDVSLGGGDDIVYARYLGTSTLSTGITGRLDGGAGTNSIVLAPAADLTVSTAVTLPDSFQRLRLEPAKGTTLTLADGFVAPGTLELAGAGTIVNATTITTTGQAFVRPYYVSGAGPSLINTGTIQATVALGYYGLDLDSLTLTNSGTITVTGNGVRQSVGGALSNTGTIVASGTAVSQFDGALNNAGLIRSTGGIGADLSGNSDLTPALNSGRIEGATYGVVTDYTVTNSGTIAATGSGTAVGLSNYGVLNNVAGGVIAGGAYAITGFDPYGSTSVYNGAVLNAGTINGDVTFVSLRDSGSYPNHNTFVALDGGVLNGNLTLGRGDTLVTNLTNTGPGLFAGINGTVTGTGSLLRYRVSGSAQAVIGAIGPFATTGYELVDGAALTVTAPTPQTLPVVLAGTGTVDLNADVTVTNGAALSVVSPVPRVGQNVLSSNLTIINRGTLSGRQTDYYSGAFGVAVLDTGSTLDNEGTIKAAYVATNGGQSYNAAVVYGAGLTNAGRIELDGSYGAYNVTTVNNSGAIVQTGPGSSIGITGAATVTNSGTIQTAGVAVQAGYSYSTSVTNSGTIRSTGTSAIAGISDGQIRNLAGGTISGGAGAAAIAVSGGSVFNAGAIIGDVTLSPYYASSGVYYVDGGTITGNLTLTPGDDLFLQRGDSPGVSGKIDAGAGRNIYGRALTASGKIAIGPAPAAGFQDAMVAAFGTDTVATLTGVDAAFKNVYAVGDGTVANQATLTGMLKTSTSNYTLAGVVGSSLGTLANAGQLLGGISGDVGHVVNTGTIGSATLNGRAVAISDRGGLSFDNEGRITSNQAPGSTSYLIATDTLALSNSGTIEDRLIAVTNVMTQGVHGSLTVSNSGSITSARRGTALIVDATGWQSAAGGSVTIENRGMITATGTDLATGLGVSLDGSGSAIDYAVHNSGTISATTLRRTDGASAVGLYLDGTGAVSGTIANDSGGTISASGPNAVALSVQGTALTLQNAGVITATGANAFAIQATGPSAATIVDTGTIKGDVRFGTGDDRFTITGLFAGSVDGGDGTDTIAVSGGSAAAPVAFGSIVNVETFGVSGGSTTIAGKAAFAALDVTGGRLTGLAGSAITAPQIFVRAGATFGSAGSVTGNLSVAGTLSPGASPGTMMVNGNVALASGSNSLFELGSPISDKLVVNGAVAIASGATLTLTGTAALRPGTTYDLILASGGINGAYTTVVKPDALTGFVIQKADRIGLLAGFADNAAFAPQISRSIAYANARLAAQLENSPLLAVVPSLLLGDTASNPEAFARLTPEPYASATQMGVDDGLILADVARGPAFAASGTTPHAFTFASTLGQWHRLGEDARAGSAATRTRGYGFLGGLGVGTERWSIGVYGGYLNNRQDIDSLAARTTVDGGVGGVQGRFRTASGFAVSASIAYDGGTAVTSRTLPRGSARGTYGLHTWVGDVTARYELAAHGDWALKPQVGITYLRTTRESVAETGGSPFALSVARDRHVSGFADAALAFGRRETSDAAFRPFVSLGGRYQIEGTTTDALAGYAGGGFGLLAVGAPRARFVGTAIGGIDYRLPSGLDLYTTVTSQTGRDDHQESVTAGVRLRF